MSDQFNSFYASIYGTRWPALLSALKEESAENKKVTFSLAPDLPSYTIDEASLIPPRFLDPGPGDSVLDLCAAPGGKTLALMHILQGREKELWANDRSTDRYFRLKRVLEEHSPAEYRANLKVTRSDGRQFGLKYPNLFDRILLDAPCSSEAHLLKNTRLLDEWKLGRSKGLAKEQYALLASAYLCLRPGGRIVYSTCSISPFENDAVIERLLSRKSDMIQISPPSPLLLGESTKYGVIVLPDRFHCGPLYIAILQKVAPDTL